MSRMPRRCACVEHHVEVGERAEERVDVAVVGDVVAGVLLRRALERAQPDGVDAEVGEVVEVRRDAGEVADAVARAVGEGARVDLVDHGGAPPLRGGGDGGQVGALGEVGRSHPASLPSFTASAYILPAPSGACRGARG